MRHRRLPSAWLRVLATWLVAISLLGNGIAVAAAAVPAATHDCCAGKHASAGGDCAHGGKPCLPGGSAACADSCIARIGGLMASAFPVLALAPTTAPAPDGTVDLLRAPFDPDPGLRPPISA